MQEERSTLALGEDEIEALEILSRYPWVRLGDRNDPLLPAVDGAGSCSAAARLTERGLVTWQRLPAGAHAKITEMGRRALVTAARETARARVERLSAERFARESYPGPCVVCGAYHHPRCASAGPPPGIARQQADLQRPDLDRPMHPREAQYIERLRSGVYEIAYCPDHGLHGRRETCNECGGPVQQIPMLALVDDPPLIHPEERHPPNPWASFEAAKPEPGRLDSKPHLHGWSATGMKDTGLDPVAYRWDCDGCDEQIWCSDPDGPDGKRLRAEAAATAELTVAAAFAGYPQEKLWAYLLTIPAMLVAERPTGDEVRHELRIAAAAARTLSDRGEQPMETHRLDSSDEKLYEALGQISAAVYGPEPEPEPELEERRGETVEEPDHEEIGRQDARARMQAAGLDESPAKEVDRLQGIVAESYRAYGVLAEAVYGAADGWTSFDVLAKRAVEELQARDSAIEALNAERDRMEDAEDERERRRSAHRELMASAAPSRRFDDPGHAIAPPGDGPVPLPLMSDEQLARGLARAARALHEQVVERPPDEQPAEVRPAAWLATSEDAQCVRCGGVYGGGSAHGPGYCLDRTRDRVKRQEADEARRRAEADRTWGA